MAGNILAIQIGPNEPSAVLPWDGVPFQDGWRAVMRVNKILGKVQSTVMFGDSLYMIWYNIGTMSPQQGFSFWLKEYYNKSMNYGQLVQPPFAAIPGRYRMLVPTPPPPPPAAQGTMTLLSSGFDPLNGYWVEFAGNFWLTSPIFKDFPLVIRDGPDYKGFQPSQNNPGGNQNNNC